MFESADLYQISIQPVHTNTQSTQEKQEVTENDGVVGWWGGGVVEWWGGGVVGWWGGGVVGWWGGGVVEWWSGGVARCHSEDNRT